MEQTLGNVTHYLNLRRHESVVAGCTPRWLPVEYRASRVPWTITGSLLARRELRQVVDRSDAIFIHTMTLAPLSADLFRRRPTVLSSDGTPLNKKDMRLAYGLKPQRGSVERAKRLLYRQLFARANGFVAWSNWTKESFVNDYGCRDEDVIVIPPGIDLQEFSIGDRNHELPRILFVGGDFVRKGGDLLLKVFRDRLVGKAELILVTAADLAPEPGVSLYRDLKPNSDTLRQLYATSDIFVLPTRADCYSLVCMEALAAGLPIVATRMGGIPDIIREGETGHLVDVDDADALGDALLSLASAPERRRKMGLLAREEALRRFDARENARRLFQFVCGRA